MWKFNHWFFGWDYIVWRNTADQGVARIHVDGTGCPYYWRYKIVNVADRIEDADRVIWLTCSPSKYLPIPVVRH